MVILGSVISFAISANQAVIVTENHLRASMLPVTSVDIDSLRFEEIVEETGTGPATSIPTYLLREIGELPHVESYDYSTFAHMHGASLERYLPTVEDVEGTGGIIYLFEDELGSDIQLKGSQNPNILDMEEELIQLVRGRVFTEGEINNLSNVVLVSEEFALLNNLAVGSTISLCHYLIDIDWSVHSPGNFTLSKEHILVRWTYDLEIIGTFEPNLTIRPDRLIDDFHALYNLYNRFYVPNNFLEAANCLMFEAMVEHGLNKTWWGEEIPLHEDFYLNMFILYDPYYLPHFHAAVGEILPEIFRVFDTSNPFRNIAATLVTMGQLTSSIMWGAIGATIVIITLLIMLFLRDRKQEIGIYLSLGENKRGVIYQIGAEVLTVACVAILVSLFIGNIVAENIAKDMLANDLTARINAERAEQGPWGGIPEFDHFGSMGFRNETTAEDIVESYSVALTPRMILVFIIASLGTILLSIVIPTIYITRINPRKIMM